LNESRNLNQACSLGRYVYTFGGYRNGTIASIERLDAKSLLDGIAVSWTLIQPQCQGWTARNTIAAAPVSETQIMLMGGSFKSDTYLFDTSSVN